MFTCAMPIGMVEISSGAIDSKIRPGARAEKGQELGHFQFGGSTYGILFEKGVVKGFTGMENSPNFVGQVIAFANS